MPSTAPMPVPALFATVKDKVAFAAGPHLFVNEHCLDGTSLANKLRVVLYLMYIVVLFEFVLVAHIEPSLHHFNTRASYPLTCIAFSIHWASGTEHGAKLHRYNVETVLTAWIGFSEPKRLSIGRVIGLGSWVCFDDVSWACKCQRMCVAKFSTQRKHCRMSLGGSWPPS